MMGFVGNTNGPRKSVIVSKLGAKYFGKTEIQLLEDIECLIEEEDNREIDPVHIDENNNAYIFFQAPYNEIQKFYLEKEGYILKGKVKAIINDEEKEIEL